MMDSQTERLIRDFQKAASEGLEPLRRRLAQHELSVFLLGFFTAVVLALLALFVIGGW